MHWLNFIIGSSILLGPTGAWASGTDIPPCRLDGGSSKVVYETLTRSAAAFKNISKELPLGEVRVNQQAATGNRILAAYVVTDANANGIDKAGCPIGPLRNDTPLDTLSVRGGCVLVAIEEMEIRCSANAVRVFGQIGQREGRANPALLYVLSHELGHLHQKRLGEYAGRAERFELGRSRATKLKELQDSCDPTSQRMEADADAMAVAVLIRHLSDSPYREPLYSNRGSFYWNIDQLALASDAWETASLEREFISRPTVHRSFVPTSFPTPKATVVANARRFVCDVLTTRSGTLYYPGKSLTHPPVEQRLRRIAEALEPIAKKLPDNSKQRQFEAVARLQTDLSPILTHIYRETGVYLEAVQASVCTMVNAATPPSCQ